MAEDPFGGTQYTAQTQPPHIYRPIPRRIHTNGSQESESPDPFQQTQSTPKTELSSRSSDFLAQLNARLLRTNNLHNGNAVDGAQDTGAPSRNKSLLNLTGSTLYGIYDDVGVGSADRSTVDTPWGTGAETPARHYSIGSNASDGTGYENGLGSPDGGLRMKDRARRGTIDKLRHRTASMPPKPQRHGVWKAIFIAGKLLSLFAFGAVYGVIVSHLHDSRELSAVQVGGVDRESWTYLTGWGLAGLVLGSLLPYIDLVSGSDQQNREVQDDESEKQSEPTLGGQWNEVVRSVGAFVGIAFAIRRLPWQSTLQLTLTLALVNPALWYILDRSRNGVYFSLITTSILTSLIFLSNPDVLPSPALPATMNSTHMSSSAQHQQQQDELFAGVVSYDNLATATWVGSVIFCSCICFGGIGRRLAVFDEWGWKK